MIDKVVNQPLLGDWWSAKLKAAQLSKIKKQRLHRTRYETIPILSLWRRVDALLQCRYGIQSFTPRLRIADVSC